MPKQNTKKELLALFKSIDTKIKSKAIIVSIGGTALTLLGYKDFSYDLDLIITDAENPEEFYNAYYATINELGLSQGEHPPFTAFDMSLLEIKDYLKKSDFFKSLKFKRITLCTMNIMDIIISKNFRGFPRDKEDIVLIMNSHRISRQALQARYLELLKQQAYDVRPLFEQKYKELFRNFGHLLK